MSGWRARPPARPAGGSGGEYPMAAFIDEDPQGRSMEGLLGLQLHTGQPMKNEFRNIYYKKL
jgi:hypothetical protein